jgi:hypothetical protein
MPSFDRISVSYYHRLVHLLLLFVEIYSLLFVVENHWEEACK